MEVDDAALVDAVKIIREFLFLLEGIYYLQRKLLLGHMFISTLAYKFGYFVFKIKFCKFTEI